MPSTKIALHVTPRSGRDCVSGLKNQGEPFGDEVCIRVTAPPDGGKANKAVVKVLAQALGVPKSSVTVLRGETSRHKQVEVPLDQAAVDAWLATLERL
jgi:uncharacterized protein (TIGR00251 family)